MRVLSVVGNRPQFIKSAPLSAALRDAGIDEVVVHTGQHWDAEMSQVFFEELGLPEPAHRLDLRTADVDALRPPIEELVAAEQPDWVLVYGDTNSTAAGGRAGAAKAVPVAHVEAGLRSGDLAMPEERNRIEVDRVAALLFAPDERSAETLRAEGVHGEIAVVGDVMADATLRFAPVARVRAPIDREPGSYAVATVHREANVLQPRLRPDRRGPEPRRAPRALPRPPAHSRGDRARGPAARTGRRAPAPARLPRLGLARVAGARDPHRLGRAAEGGVLVPRPGVTLRPSTEWVDTLAAGANVLVDDDPERIAEAANTAAFPENAPPLYGDGRASVAIAHTLARLSRS